MSRRIFVSIGSSSGVPTSPVAPKLTKHKLLFLGVSCFKARDKPSIASSATFFFFLILSSQDIEYASRGQGEKGLLGEEQAVRKDSHFLFYIQ